MTFIRVEWGKVRAQGFLEDTTVMNDSAIPVDLDELASFPDKLFLRAIAVLCTLDSDVKIKGPIPARISSGVEECTATAG